MSKIIYENNTIKKKYYDWQNERFINEIYWLKKLSKFNFVPKVLAIDYKKRVLTLTNEGQRVNSFNIPKNWKVQLNKILNLLIESNCFHGDINSENLLVKNKKLKLIDFAQSTKKRGGENYLFKKKDVF